jgi:hypothetical protein
LRSGAVERVFGRVPAYLVWIGLIRGHFYVLEVRGRKSGKTFTLPVDPIEFEGRHYLVCARGNSNWVRNARIAGEVALARAMRRRRYAVRELPPACARRSSKPISTDSQARCSASSQYRRGRRWKHSVNWRRVTRSSSCSHWTRPLCDDRGCTVAIAAGQAIRAGCQRSAAMQVQLIFHCPVTRVS